MPPAEPASAAGAPTEIRQLRFVRPPGAASLLLIRHGESAPARPDTPFDLVDGHGDPPLAERGLRQAEQVAARLAAEPISAIYVTNLRRTGQTAAPLARALGLEPVVEADLREVHLGEWEGGLYRLRMTEGGPLARRMIAEERWDVIPGAEPAERFAARVVGALGRIAGRHADQTVAVFTHGGVIGQALAHATGSRPFAFVGADNASVSHLVVIGDRWVVRTFNDAAHLHPGFTASAEVLS